MVEFSQYTGMIMDWLLNPLLWLFIIIFFFILLMGALYIRKRRKLIFPSIEVTDFGFNSLKCGWFGKQTTLFGLWDYGQPLLKTPNGEVISQYSEEDFVEVNGKRGVVFFREPINRKLLPIRFKLDSESGKLIGTIPKRDYVNTAIEIINDATKETSDWKNKVMMALLIGGIVVFALVAVILITQMVKNGQKEASDLIIKAGTVCSDNCKTICSEIASTYANPSNAP